MGGGKAMHTLDLRESRSSLAGVMMAAAMEGMGVYEFSRHVVPRLEDVPRAVEDVLSRVNLPVLPGGGALAADPPVSAAAPAPPEEAAAAPAGGAAAAAAPPAPPAQDAADAKGAGAAKPPEEKPAKAKEAEPAAKEKDPAQEAAAKVAEETRDTPSATDLPDGPVRLKPSEGGPEPAAAAAAPPAAPAPRRAGASRRAGGAGAAPGGARGGRRSRAVRDGGHGRDADARGDRPARQQERRARRGRDRRPEGGQDRSAHRGRADQAQPGAQDHRLEHGQRPREVHLGRLGLQPPRRARAGHRGDRRPDRRAGKPAGARGGVGAGGAGSEHPPERDRVAVRHLRGRLLHRRRASEPHPRRLRRGAPGGFPAARRARGRRGARRRGSGRRGCGRAGGGGSGRARRGGSGRPRGGGAPQRASGLFSAIKAGDQAKAASSKGAGDSGIFARVDDPQPPAAAAAASPAEPAAAGAPDLANAPTDYPGDDAPREQLAAWMAAEAKKRGIPPQLPVMAALVESNLKNLNFGDADSVGFFQMRLSIWNQGPYAGYPDDPDKQIDWFLDTAEQVKAQRVAAGESVTDPSQFGEWIADVERPAEQFRGRYQLAARRGQRAARGRAGRARRPGRPRGPGAAGRPRGAAGRARGRRRGQHRGGDEGAARQRQRRPAARRPRGPPAGHRRSAHRGGHDRSREGPQDRPERDQDRPRPVHVQRLGLEPLLRPRDRHRVGRRLPRLPRKRGGARPGVGHRAAQGSDPPDRGRLAVADRRARVLHRRRPPGPRARGLRR